MGDLQEVEGQRYGNRALYHPNGLDQMNYIPYHWSRITKRTVFMSCMYFTLQVVIRGEDSFAFEDADNPDYQEELPESRNVDRPKTVKCFFVAVFSFIRVRFSMF